MELGEILRACGIALIALSLCAVLKAKSVALSPYLTQTAALSIVMTSLSALIPLFAFIKELSGQANINVSYLETMTLAGGIAFIAKITADICKENGENMLKSNREVEKIFSDGRKYFGESLSIRSDTYSPVHIGTC